MGVELTLAIVKPDAVQKKVVGKIIERIEKAGLAITSLEMIEMDESLAEGFYAVHKDKPFFGDLVEFMTSGPCVVMCLEGEGAVQKWRTLMGATDPTKAETGTIRKDFGTNIEKNACHGSDALETAAFEVQYFFG